MAEGTHGPMRVWPNLNSAVAWTSMVTGCNPGKHGIYDFGDAPPQRGQRWRPITGSDRRKDPFWRLLSAKGRHVGIINVPISYPADSLNGFMLSGMDAPGLHSPGFAHPPDLLEQLRQQDIDYVLDVPNMGTSSRRAPHGLPVSVRRMVDARARTLLHLMASRPWDVLMAVFVATDRVQHFYWPVGTVPLEDARWAPIRQLYQQIDGHLASILERIDEDTTILLVSDHGFGPVRSVLRCLNPLFARLGLLHYLEGRNRARGRLLRTLLLYGRRIVPQRFQLPLAQAFPRLRLHAISEHKYGGIDWSQTQVFATWGRLHINLQGRQQEGIVAPEEYQCLREHVREILLGLTEPTTGHQLVRAVHRREEIYCGPYTEQAADLVVEWDEKVARDVLRYDGEGEPIIIRAPQRIGPGGRIVGGHESQGIFVAWGPHIRRGAEIAGPTLYDIAPTILYLQDRPVPSDMDGQVLAGIFPEEYLRRNPVRYSEPSGASEQGAETVLDAEDSRTIEERLRGLGYIE
jgi:predicted AlkP superfamily phosphohydrolase/phosphomutase